jgi:hypothetical protein
MATVARPRGLHGTEDFAVESPDGAIGRVEEIWLGPTDEPRALAVRTSDGSHALLLDEDVLSVDRDRRWVVVRAQPELLELSPPRLAPSDGDHSASLAASWSTTGALVHPAPPARLGGLRRRMRRTNPRVAERPLWQLVAILYGSVAFIVAFVVALVFVVARIVTGAPY